MPTRLDADRYGRQMLPLGVLLLGDDRLDQQLAALMKGPAPAPAGADPPPSPRKLVVPAAPAALCQARPVT